MQPNSHGFIEPGGVLVERDVSGNLTVWTSTPSPFHVRRNIAEVLNMPASKVRVIKPNVGGGFVSPIAPTTGDDRMKKITAHASGFLYYISVMGITGTKKPEIEAIKKDMARIRLCSPLPVAVGFGISTPEQAAEIAPYADGVVVGSAFVRMIEENSGRDNLVSVVAGYAADIKKALPKSP